MSAKYTARVVRNVLVALAVAAGLGGLLFVLQGPSPTGEATPPAPVETTAPAGVTTDPERWRAAFPLEHPSGLDRVADSPELRRAVELFDAGRYQEASPALEDLAADPQHGATASLYLGIARLYMDEVPSGIETLRQAEAQAYEQPMVLAAARWYSLVGIARLREPASGIGEVRAACDQPGPYSERACAALEQLTHGGQP